MDKKYTIDFKDILFNSLDHHHIKDAKEALTRHQAVIEQAIATSDTSKSFAEKVNALAHCSQFYAIIFTINDSEINSECKHHLSKLLQSALYSGDMDRFLREIEDLTKHAKDDYEYDYYLSLHHATLTFIRTVAFKEFKDAKDRFEQDQSIACQELKRSIEQFRYQMDHYINHPFITKTEPGVII